jgi:CheY-like chemotaxis protein
VYSELGLGTTMCVYLPRHYEGEAVDEPALQVEEAPHPGAGTVLVVDDEPTVRALVIDVLGELGYRLLEADEGATGLALLQSNVPIDLLITDVGLPNGMNGRQLADAARASRPDLKVLFITGYAENAVVGNGHLDPGMEIMTKPFTLDALALRVQQMVAAKS